MAAVMGRGRNRPVGSMGVASAPKKAKISATNPTNQIAGSRSATLEIPLQWKLRWESEAGDVAR